MDDVLMATDLPLPLHSRGKVRDIYELGEVGYDHINYGQALLIVATDRISAYDLVMPNGIPGKGQVLTEMSIFWFRFLRTTFPNHWCQYPVTMPSKLRRFEHTLDGRSMIVRKAESFKVECVVRGYITGSGWRDYQKTGTVCGIQLPPGLVESQKLPEPIFTPATKAESGHDENIPFETMVKIIEDRTKAELLRLASLALYNKAHDYALGKGIVIADTKFEFGLGGDGGIILIDEVLTPDSSRFWPADQYEPGRSQPSFDKQFVRDYLDSVGWDRKPPAPVLPDEIVAKTAEKYQEALRRLCG